MAAIAFSDILLLASSRLLFKLLLVLQFLEVLAMAGVVGRTTEELKHVNLEADKAWVAVLRALRLLLLLYLAAVILILFDLLMAWPVSFAVLLVLMVLLRSVNYSIHLFCKTN